MSKVDQWMAQAEVRENLNTINIAPASDDQLKRYKDARAMIAQIDEATEIRFYFDRFPKDNDVPSKNILN